MPHIIEDGSVYEGELDRNGKLAGFGSLSRPDGTQYEGFFLDGAFHGEGSLKFSNGTTYTAQWERGAEVPGTGALTWEDGLVFNPQQQEGEGAGAAGAAGSAAAAAALSPPEARVPGEEWGYLSSKDRRMWSEHKEGRRAATSPRREAAQVQTRAGGEAAQE